MRQLDSDEIICCTYGSDTGASIRYCGPKTDYVMRQMVAGRFYEGRMLSWIYEHWPEGLVFVDAGAYIGIHSLYFAMVCKAARVYAFEPHPLSFGFLRGNISINKAANVVPLKVALGSKLARANLMPCTSGDFGGSHIEMAPDGPIQVMPLDYIVHERVDVMKIDAEGSSLRILRGARTILAQSQPDVFVECGGKDDCAAINGFLTSFGYVQMECFNATPTYLYIYPGASRGDGKGYNESDSAT